MTADLSHWTLENLYLVPIVFVLLVIAMHNEIKKVHRRLDAILELLRQRGIDLLHLD